MADRMALEHLRVFRQLLVTRCGLIALTIAAGGLLLGLFHSFAFWFSEGIFVLAPAAVWMLELRQERGLRKKVVKSS
jgi:predicted Co/Zn/Cd cation transporter (cation efflux family)